MHHEITCINIYIITAKCIWKYDQDHVKCNVKCFIAEPFVFHWLNARVLPFDGNRGGKNVSWILRANKACVTAVLLENKSSLRCCSWEKWAPASSRFSTDLHGARWNIHKCMWTYNSYTDHKMTSEQHNMWIPTQYYTCSIVCPNFFENDTIINLRRRLCNGQQAVEHI